MVSDAFFQPESVAVIGASEVPGKIGSGLMQAMLPCRVRIYPVNPHYGSVFGLPCFPSADALPAVPTHAYIAVPRDAVLPSLRDCVKRGIPNAVVISSGFKEKDETGAELERKIAALAKSSGIRLLGPNTLGILNGRTGFNGSFLPMTLTAGCISVISQSGGVGMALLSALADQRCGIARWAGIGNEAGIVAEDVLDYLAADPETRCIAVCFEGLRNLPAFLRRAAEVNREKPVVLLRDGKSRVGLQAAASHTGAMVYSGNVLPSLLRQFGLQEADSVRDCAVMLKALSIAPEAKGRRAVLLTNTAGPSVLAADTLECEGIDLPPVPEELRRRIDEEAGLPMELKNPADISSNGLSPRNYGIAAGRLLESGPYDLLLGFFSLNEHLQLPEKQLTEAALRSGKPVVACFLASQQKFSAYPALPERAGIPCFCDPHDAAVAAAAILNRGADLKRAAEPAPVLEEARAAACASLLESLHCRPERRRILSERESRELLRRAGASVFVPLPAADPEEAVRAACECGFPCALKLESSRITHKSRAGGVRLHLNSPQEVRRAAEEMLEVLREADPDAGLTVQPMAPEGFEMIVGAVRSPLGTLLMAGAGGRYAEALDDTAFCLLPAGCGDFRRLLRSLRCARVFCGEDGALTDGGEALLDILCVTAALAERFPEITELEMNPCRLSDDGVRVLDARAVATG